jgi:hypothetical protein
MYPLAADVLPLPQPMWRVLFLAFAATYVRAGVLVFLEFKLSFFPKATRNLHVFERNLTLFDGVQSVLAIRQETQIFLQSRNGLRADFCMLQKVDTPV